MKTPIATDDPAYWRRRAEELRQEVENLEDSTAKQIMTEIAQAYEELAQLVERKLTSGG